MKFYRLSEIENDKNDKNDKIAFHLTTEDMGRKILDSGNFLSSSSGWHGKGLYAHLSATGKEGKGSFKVGFSYSDLKLNDCGNPIELSKSEWDKLRDKDTRTIDKVLSGLGYDGEIYGTVLRIFPQSVHKLVPIDIS